MVGTHYLQRQVTFQRTTAGGLVGGRASGAMMNVRLDDEGGTADVYVKAELHSQGIVQIDPQEMPLNLPKPSELEVYEVPVEVNGDSALAAERRYSTCMEMTP
ncbi:hypothetical protein MGG_00267 [Pyricularia oryzae 70-15]|uniref:Uncharacterized protein n=1 Tax=Pyricularia oryzae (strain 70-15 / ATCC MYA-4617 / FGSC 8958) TaxID=242507 RepID=G4NDB1_PYRO7|nr:uncharacterized protein MGG_00267 [Pyricularia oryzae 70-15]EHA49249.1 hypothetical protein MGG_00267 [Pyricularia oryzae 70-15]